MAGNLYAFKFESQEEIKENHKQIYEAGHTITNIRTSRVKNSNEHFYITMSDVRGFVHLLKGFKSEIDSYSLVTKI